MIGSGPRPHSLPQVMRATADQSWPEPPVPPPYDAIMPMITVQMMPGRSDAQKAELVSRLTDVFLETCGSPGQHRKGVWVIIDEVPGEHWAVGGEMLRKPDSQQ
mgnify:CR=1 FL=1